MMQATVGGNATAVRTGSRGGASAMREAVAPSPPRRTSRNSGTPVAAESVGRATSVSQPLAPPRNRVQPKGSATSPPAAARAPANGRLKAVAGASSASGVEAAATSVKAAETRRSSSRDATVPRVTNAAAEPTGEAPAPAATRGVAQRTKVAVDAMKRRPASGSAPSASALLSRSATAVASALPNTSAPAGLQPHPRFYYRTDLEKAALHFAFKRFPNAVELKPAVGGAGASTAAAANSRADKDDGFAASFQSDWNVYWMSVSHIRLIFHSSEFRLNDFQIINHFPNHSELTRKDLMYKNIKKYLRERGYTTSSGYGPLGTSAVGSAQAHPRPGSAAAVSKADRSISGGYNQGSVSIVSYTQAGPLAHLLKLTAAASDPPLVFTFGGGRQSDVVLESPQSSTLKELKLAACVPMTFYLPNDRHMLAEELKRQPGSTWIVKPTNRSQGKGIFLINRFPQLSRWIREKRSEDGEAGAGSSPVGAGGATFSGGTGSGGAAGEKPLDDLSTFIVSRYVDNPLLIGGKKFDLRLYVLVTSFKPLVAYIHRRGFARFCATKYNNNIFLQPGSPSTSGDVDMGVWDREGLGSHLTNVALQKDDGEYNTVHGGKWSIDNLWLYVQGRFGMYAADALMADIEFVIFHSLRAMETVMSNDSHSFELYGYDILIDSQLRPHLIEVNASPSLTATTQSDRLWKEEVLFDTLRIVLPPGYPDPSSMPYWEYRLRTNLTTKIPTGFKLLNGIVCRA